MSLGIFIHISTNHNSVSFKDTLNILKGHSRWSARQKILAQFHTWQHDELFRQWRSDWRPCLFRFHRVRYFVTGHNGSVANQPMPPVNDGTTKLSRIVSLIRTVKEEQRDVSSEQHTAELGDFVNRPGQDSSFKMLNETAAEDTSSYHCPDTIEEMLLIVSKHRRNRLDIISSQCWCCYVNRCWRWCRLQPT